MNSPVPLPAPTRRGPSRWKLLFWLLVVPALLATGYFAIVLKWNYSTGERAGWVQKFSKKGWLCKTWEGEMAMVSMPGAIPEKFLFTVWDDNVAASINKVMGKRVTLHYQEKVGLPTTCFGETRHFVTGVIAVDEFQLGPDTVVPTPQPAPASPQAPAAPVAPAIPPVPQGQPSPAPAAEPPPPAPAAAPAK
jgi:hypothetical protein